MEKRVLCHFAMLTWTDAYYALAREERQRRHRQWLETLRAAAERVYVYQIFPARAEADILVWSSIHAEDPQVPDVFFRQLGQALHGMRPHARIVWSLWGLTKPSIYARGSSAQEMDPFADTRKRYLIAYPFVKTPEWYLLSRDTRQGMMNEHIRVGRQYPTILQLLLYSFGLQDQEFVVVYETDDLVQFSDLVFELRSTEARRYTERDTPIITAVYRPAEETLAMFA